MDSQDEENSTLPEIELPESADYSDMSGDVVAVMGDGIPVAIVPLSSRDKALFAEWGMTEDHDGIVPPDNAMDLISSMPSSWIMAVAKPRVGTHILYRTTLPRPVPVLH